ncbi:MULTISPECIES: rhomboid family intramembrane serine protease [Anaeromyxobacter]|uniref:rhomboid family intramembrane serine protease n=1 Tax=Anaeromyxobacter TaxID=161492 RepID=UPI001F56DD28|nr:MULTISPECIES: rhomboid family intramembrane serine protease [unclassified Anaeromyxobacter]
MPTARRRPPDLGSVFTFGGRVPAAVGLLIVAMAVVTIGSWLDRRLLALLAFDPPSVVGGQVWRLLTWVFVQDSPLTLFFAGFMLWWLGQQLVFTWGERRFLLRFLGITVGAGALATLVAIVYPPAAIAHIDAWPTVNALLVVWALMYPDRPLSWFGVVNMSAKMMAALVVFGTVLYAIAYGGPGRFVVHFSALALGWVMSRGFSFGRYFRKARRSMEEREARRRAKHLKVVRRDGKDEPPRWIN